MTLKPCSLSSTHQVMYARHQVLSFKQRDDESVPHFFERFRLLVEKCESSDLTIHEHKDILLRDGYYYYYYYYLVSGLRSDIIRARLLELTNTEASLDKCKSLVTAIEMFTDFSRSFVASESSTSDSSTSSIAAVYGKRDKGQRRKNKEFSQTKCSFCGQKAHPRLKCPAKNTSCLKCKIVHWAVVCRSATAPFQPEEIPDDEAFSSAILMCATKSHGHSGIFEQIGLSKECVEFRALIDPGSTIFTESFCDSNGLDVRKSPRTSRLANGDKLGFVVF